VTFCGSLGVVRFNPANQISCYPQTSINNFFAKQFPPDYSVNMKQLVKPIFPFLDDWENPALEAARGFSFKGAF
jgi:hypothetical protein